MLKIEDLLKSLGADENAPENPAHDIARERLELERQKLELAREQAAARAEERAERIKAERARQRLREEEATRKRAAEERAGALWGFAFALSSFIFLLVAIFAVAVIAKY